jgi:hypothetical protein
MRQRIGLMIFALLGSGVLAQAPDPGRAATMPQMQQMQSRMQTMQARMAAIQAAEDPEQRQRLLQAHMQSMHESMITMGQMM